MAKFADRQRSCARLSDLAQTLEQPEPNNVNVKGVIAATRKVGHGFVTVIGVDDLAEVAELARCFDSRQSSPS